MNTGTSHCCRSALPSVTFLEQKLVSGQPSCKRSLRLLKCRFQSKPKVTLKTCLTAVTRLVSKTKEKKMLRFYLCPPTCRNAQQQRQASFNLVKDLSKHPKPYPRERQKLQYVLPLFITSRIIQKFSSRGVSVRQLHFVPRYGITVSVCLRWKTLSLDRKRLMQIKIVRMSAGENRKCHTNQELIRDEKRTITGTR